MNGKAPQNPNRNTQRPVPGGQPNRMPPKNGERPIGRQTPNGQAKRKPMPNVTPVRLVKEGEQKRRPQPPPRREETPPPRRRNEESYVFSRSLSETRERILTERRERLEDAKQFKREDVRDKVRKGLIAFGATALLIVVVVSIILASVLNSGKVKKNKGEFVYKVGTSETSEAYSDSVKNGMIYIKMSSIAELCELTVSGNTVDDLRFYTKSGDWISFAPDSDSAVINGYGISMPAPARFNDTECAVPLEFLEYVLSGISVTVDNIKNTVTVKRVEYSDSTPLEPHYTEVAFMLRTDAALSPLDENKYFKDKPLFDFKNDLSAYEDAMNPAGDKRDAFLMLLNKENTIDSDFEPEDLIQITENVPKSYWLDATAARALEAMLKEMYSEGFTDVYVTSGYRSYNYQSILYNTYISNEMEGISSDALGFFGSEYIKTNYTDKGINKLSYEDAVKVVNSYSAIPGFSEHHTGLCVDFITNDMAGDLTNVFAEKEVFDWLCANAWKFGFVLRYPEDKVDVTEYSYESWHWRFVGRHHALAMLRSGQCFEEYLAALGNVGE